LSGNEQAWYDLPARVAANELLVDVKPPLPRERGPPVDSPLAKRFSPRRNRWADVTAFDERAAVLAQRAETLNRELGHLEDRRKRAA